MSTFSKPSEPTLPRAPGGGAKCVRVGRQHAELKLQPEARDRSQAQTNTSKLKLPP